MPTGTPRMVCIVYNSAFYLTQFIICSPTTWRRDSMQGLGKGESRGSANSPPPFKFGAGVRIAYDAYK